MATEVTTLTWCDPCLADNARTEAATKARVAVTSPALDEPLTRYVDLCDDHAAAFLAPLAEFLTHYGQSEPSDGVQLSPPAARPAGKRGFECSVCHRVMTTRQSVRNHMREVHGMTREAVWRALPHLDATGTPVELKGCPVCGEPFGAGPGLAAHLRTAHPGQSQNSR